MKCQEIRELLSPYYDKMLGEAERQQVEAHLEQCTECRQELEDMKLIADLVRESGEYLAPGDFSQQVMERIAALPQTEAEPKPGWKKSGWNKPGVWVRLAGVAAVLVLTVVAGMGILGQNTFLTDKSVKSQIGAPAMPELAARDQANQADQPNQANIAQGAAAAPTFQETAPAEKRLSKSDTGNQILATPSLSKAGAQDKRKVIKTGRLQVEVTDVDKTYKDLVKMVESMQGYVENSAFQNSPQGTPAEQQFRSGSLTLRVSANRFEELTQKVGAVGRVVSSQLGGQDVSAQYYDTQARLNNWRQQEAQLGQILKQAKTIKDILLVQEQMQRVRQEIEVMEGTLKNLGELSDMATLTVDLTQVKSSQVISLPQQGVRARAREQFIASVNNLLEAGGNLFIWLVGALPVLLLLVLLLGAGYWYLKIKGGHKE